MVSFSPSSLGLPAPAAEAPAPAPRAIDPRAAIEPAAPVLPAEVVAAMQEGRFGPAQEALAQLAAKATKASEKAYYALIRGIAQRLAGQGDEARKTLSAALEAAPRGPGRPRSGSSWPRVELAAGRFAEAEALARDRGRGAAGRRPQGPARRGLSRLRPAPAQARRPDRDARRPERALTSCSSRPATWPRARRSAPGSCSRWAAPARPPATIPRAIEDFQAYLKEYPKGADRVAARYHLGEAQLSAGQPWPPA